MSLPFLLEIGTEEIPDWMIVPALNNLQDMFQAMLDQHTLGGRVEEVHATPRRLFLRAGGLLERQADVEELVLGPPKSVGAGAAAGFAKKMVLFASSSTMFLYPMCAVACASSPAFGRCPVSL